MYIQLPAACLNAKNIKYILDINGNASFVSGKVLVGSDLPFSTFLTNQTLFQEGFRKVEVVSHSIKHPTTIEEGKAIVCLINTNKVAKVTEDWEGLIHFDDDEVISTTHTYGATLTSLGIA